MWFERCRVSAQFAILYRMCGTRMQHGCPAKNFTRTSCCFLASCPNKNADLKEGNSEIL